MRAVNLLPRAEAKSRNPKAALPVLLAGLVPVVVGGSLAAIYSTESATVADRQAQLAAVEAQLAATPPPVAIDPTNTALAEEKNQRITAVGDALARRVAFDRVLRELSLVLPEDVWLSSLSARSDEALQADGAAPEPAAAPAAEGSAAPASSTTAGETPAAAAPSAPEATGVENAGFVVNGFTYSQEGVARLLSRLAVVPHLRNVRLTQSIRVPAGKRTVVQFTIIGDLLSPKEIS